MMERVVEPKRKVTEFEVEIEEEESEITIPKTRAKRVSSAPRNTRLYAQTISGFVICVALLLVPMITLPGMVILVLIAEIYLLDWTYSRFTMLRDSKSFFSNEYTGKRPEDEIDRKVVRTGPKDQLIR